MAFGGFGGTVDPPPVYHSITLMACGGFGGTVYHTLTPLENGGFCGDVSASVDYCYCNMNYNPP